MAGLIQNYDAFSAQSLTCTAQNIPASAFGKVAVLFGGRSAERSISLKTGEGVLAALLRRGIDAHAIDPDENLASVLIEGEFDRAFIALHGKEGEDGVIQGLLQMLGIPYTGSGVAASALAMDKARAKLVMHGLKIPTPIFGLANSLEEAKALASKIDFPLSVKPVAEGSSIGVSRVNVIGELAEAYTKAAAFGLVIVEKWIEGRDFFVTIIGDRVYPSLEIRSKEKFFDFKAKYESSETEYLCPAPLPANKEKLAREISYRAFCALGCTGWGRVDLVMDAKGKFWVLEVNTIPGMTPKSLVPRSTNAGGVTYDDAVMMILEMTLPATSQQAIKDEALRA